MKFLTLVFIFIQHAVVAQNCDTLRASEYIRTDVNIAYDNCHWVHVDTSYINHSWTDLDTTFLDLYNAGDFCYVLMHGKTNNLYGHLWKSGDTVTLKAFYASGKMKLFTKELLNYGELFLTIEKYYENGQLALSYSMTMSSFTERLTYYPDGAIHTKGIRYGPSFEFSGDYVEYYPTGEISSIQTYSQPNTNDSMRGQYQSSELLGEVFYDLDGNIVDSNLNVYDYFWYNIYPMEISGDTIINERFHNYLLFQDQEAYAQDMHKLKTKLLKSLKLKSCSCRKGVIKFSLTISDQGVVKLLSIDFPNEEVKKQLSKSIGKIKYWPPAVYNNQKVDTIVDTYLILDL